MLDWFSGASRPQPVYGFNQDGDQTYLEEPPETPAPLFAVRAFKTALFGTPAPPAHKIHEKAQPPAIEQAAAEGARVHRTDALSHMVPKSGPTVSITAMLRPDSLASPAKGILLTPGTGTTRRKTVSFGGMAKSLEHQAETAHDPDDKAKLSEVESLVLATSRTIQPDQPRETSLNKKLFKRCDEGQGVDTDKRFTTDAALSEHFKMASVQHRKMAPNDNTVGGGEGESEMTTDLKDPRSKSGQHWKREYSRYHEKSDHEMRKLIRYSQIAKSYAVKRDLEASSLNEKLKKSLARVAEMEAKVAELAMQLASGSTHEKDRVSDQADLLNQLATQTARALRYKYEAEKYEIAIREHGLTSALTNHQCVRAEEKSDEGTTTVADALSAPDQTAELKSLRSEVSSLRNVAESAEEKAAQLTLENTTFKNTIRRVKEEMKKYEIRHKASEERRKQRDHDFKVQKRTLEVNLAQCKFELETQIEKHLNKMTELAGEKGHLEVKDNGTPQGMVSQEHLVEDLEKQIRCLKGEISSLSPDLLQSQQRKMSQELRKAREDLQKSQLEIAELKLRVNVTNVGNPILPNQVNPQQQKTKQSSSLDVWTDMTKLSRKSYGQEQSPPVSDVKRIDKKERNDRQQPVLTEIDSNNIEQRPLSRNAITNSQSKPLKANATSLPYQPPPEASMSIPSTSSRRPSLLAFPSSPPTRRSSSYIPPRIRQPPSVPAPHELPRSKKNSNIQPTGRSKLGSLLRGERKSSLPPDRAAAARLRLEMKNQEKAKGGSRARKENSRV